MTRPAAPVRVRAMLPLVAALAVIALATLTPTPGATGSNGFCLFCGSLGATDFVLNVALFVPLGAAAWHLTRRIPRTVMAGFLVTAVVEALQIRLVTGRDAAAGDILANTLGTLAGAALAVAVVQGRHATPVVMRRLAGTAGILVAALIALSSILLQPIQTRYPQWLQWTPVKRNDQPFRGTLHAVEFNQRALRRGDIIRAYGTLDSATRSMQVRATVDGNVPTFPPMAIIVRIANDWEEGFQFAQQRRRVVFRSHTIASRFRFRTPLVGIDGAFAAPNALPDPVMTVEARSSPSLIEMTYRRGTRTEALVVPRSVGLGWTMVLPWPVAVDAGWLPANAAWLALLVLPVAFLTARSRPASRFAIAGWPVGLVLVTMILAPIVTGLSPLGLVEWMGVIAGAAAGALLHRGTAA